jgi:transposase-like protein
MTKGCSSRPEKAAGSGEDLRGAVTMLVQAALEAKMTAAMGAEKDERTERSEKQRSHGRPGGGPSLQS